MTFTAAVLLPEALARRLVDAIGEDLALGELSLDLSELGPGRWQVLLYCDERPGEKLIASFARLAKEAGATSVEVTVTELPETNWVAKSLAGLAPVRAGRFLVHGSHDRDRRRPNDLAIEIEAGEAFGTGHHGTTAACLMAIDRVMRARRIRNALDLGTGSGVLAIAIAKAGKAHVLASDIDPVATRIAAENARLNGVSRYVRTVTAAGLRREVFAEAGPFDLIVANILAGPLVALAPAIRGHMTPGGTLVLSGLLVAQKARVVSAYRRQGLRLVRDIGLGGWLTLVFERRAVRAGRANGRSPRSRRAHGQRSRASRRRGEAGGRSPACRPGVR